MAESMNADPDWWRRMGGHNHNHAAGLREWAEPPAQLDHNEKAVGAAGQALSARMQQYWVDARHPGIHGLADGWGDSGDNCYATADALICTDHGGADRVRASGASEA
ncbi:hypothetical protein [Nocardia sp. NPDC046763]|uniref:hypothetical protein n=1 Tax=Nocardia sp. NPDC046763 TaxID=3155256 RepID=UPI0033D4CF64